MCLLLDHKAASGLNTYGVSELHKVLAHALHLAGVLDDPLRLAPPLHGCTVV